MFKKLAKMILRKELLKIRNDGILDGYAAGMLAGRAESRNLGTIIGRLISPRGLAEAQDILRRKQ